MRAYLFPGQSSQSIGMGQVLYNTYSQAQALFEDANQILGFKLTTIMFNGTEEALQRTQITQPAVFVCSTILAIISPTFKPAMVAGHSLGEFSALVAAGVLSFEDGLRLVSARASFMEEACRKNPGVMAAIVGLTDQVVEQVCLQLSDVVPANYNAPGQLVISGTLKAVEKACQLLQQVGAKKVVYLKVGGGFHSPLMEPASEALQTMIEQISFLKPTCPIYQNVSALPVTDPIIIKRNLIAQLTAPLFWKQTIGKMVEDGATSFVECGPGNVLQGLVRRIATGVDVTSLA